MQYIKCACLSFFVFASCVFVFAKKSFIVRSDYTLQVVGGESINVIANRLEQNNIIDNATFFKVFFKAKNIFNKCYKVHIGEYELLSGQHFNDVIDIVCNGRVIQYSITIPEGLYTSQIIDIINNTNELGGDKIQNQDVDEGALLPETYNFAKGFDRKELLMRMSNALQSFLEIEWKKRDVDIPLKNKYEALILASIVEAEAKNDAERPIIASVYLNRLAKGMRLEADPTTIYELTKGQSKLDRPLTLADLRTKGDYNTYQKTGLPIGPICNPGKSSILAVMHPAKSDYLFFVAKGDLSGHVFAKTFDEHSKNIKEQRRIKPKVEKEVKEKEEEAKTVTVIDKKVVKKKSTKVKKVHTKTKHDSKKVKTKAKTKKKKNKK